VLAGVRLLLWPLALAMLVAVLVAFSVANVYLVARVTGGRQAGVRGRLISALGLALVELALLSTLRAWLASAFGFTWGV
jgi:hypothetical protein